MRHPSKSLRCSQICAVLLGIWFFYDAFQSFHQVVIFYTPLPVWDYWRVVENFPSFLALRLGFLWKQQNEHRIVIPELIFLTDMLLAHGCMILPLLLSSGFYVLTWCLLGATVVRDVGLKNWHGLMALLMSGLFAFFKSASVVLAVPFLLQWTITQAAVTYALFLFSYSGQNRSARTIAKAVLAGTVATYSSANGLLLWPFLLALAWLRQFPNRLLLLLGTCAAANTFIYFLGASFSGHFGFQLLIEHPLHAIFFVLSYVSMPFGAVKAPQFSITIGFLNLLAAVVCTAVIWKKGLLKRGPAVLLLGSYTFTLATAIMTALGRMDLSDRSYLAPRAIRYITVPQMNWAVLVLLVLWLSSQLHADKSFWIATAVLVIGFSAASVKFSGWLIVNSKPFEQAQLAARKIDGGDFDTELIRQVIFPEPEQVTKWLNTLREHNLSVYHCRPQ